MKSKISILVLCCLLTQCKVQEGDSMPAPPPPPSRTIPVPPPPPPVSEEIPISPPRTQQSPAAPPPPPPPPHHDQAYIKPSEKRLSKGERLLQDRREIYEEEAVEDIELSIDPTLSGLDRKKEYRKYHPERRPMRSYHSEQYASLVENKFQSPIQEALSTFSIDVDKAAYSNVRRFITQHQLPPADAVRLEEMINFFQYDFPDARGNEAFAIDTEYGAHPWLDGAGMLRVSLQGKKDIDQYEGSNLVFLLDVSGSMSAANKLPLLKKSFHLLLDQLDEDDMVSIVVYAGAAGTVLEPTPAKERTKILQSLRQLKSGGSTAGAEGIQLAYDLAKEHFIKGGNNRVILATDGDFNVGPSSNDALEGLIESKRDDGIFLTVLGFGMGNYKDQRLETLADKGNGNYAYIDQIREAQKVFGRELSSTLFTIAKDVKIQIEFNPAYVKSYRLVGYENRLLNKEDFNNDKKDAGELGAGHQVTALYEIIPVGADISWAGNVDPLKYQQEPKSIDFVKNGEMCTVKLRYKEPDENKSKYQDLTVSSKMQDALSANGSLAAAIAAWGMKLRMSDHLQDHDYDQILKVLRQHKGDDPYGYRAELITLVESSELLQMTMSEYSTR